MDFQISAGAELLQGLTEGLFHLFGLIFRRFPLFVFRLAICANAVDLIDSFALLGDDSIKVGRAIRGAEDAVPVLPTAQFALLSLSQQAIAGNLVLEHLVLARALRCKLINTRIREGRRVVSHIVHFLRDVCWLCCIECGGFAFHAHRRCFSGLSSGLLCRGAFSPATQTYTW